MIDSWKVPFLKISLLLFYDLTLKKKNTKNTIIQYSLKKINLILSVLTITKILKI